MTEQVTPLEYIEYVMEQMGWNQRDLLRMGCNNQQSHISEMLSGKRRLNIKFIRVFLEQSYRMNMAYMLLADYKLINPKSV